MIRHEALGLFLEHVQVAHRAQRVRDSAQVFAERLDGLALEKWPKQAQGAAHPARGHAHIVDALDVLAQPADGFVQ